MVRPYETRSPASFRRILASLARAIVLVAGLAALTAFACLARTTTVECADGLRCPTGSQCAAEQNVCIFTSCGNRETEYALGEVCDDGNIRDDDACSGDCRVINTCGNGVIDEFERCDYAMDLECSMDCTSNLQCGNDFRDRHEVCDDGNQVSGDGCSADCQRLEFCGDANRDPGEECVPLENSGALVDSSTCDSDCTLPLCGDGHLNTEAIIRGLGHPERCDEGLDNSDLANAVCRLDCTPQRCGDRIVDDLLGEVCDEDADGDGQPDNTSRCDRDCTAPICGDGHPNTASGEMCDSGDPLAPGPVDTVSCDADCTTVHCGDRHINMASGETCDEDTNGDGNGDDTATCDKDCTPVLCGDSHINQVAGEQCDKGMGANGNSDMPDASCRTDCLPRRCGDGIDDMDDARTNDPMAGAPCDGGGDPDGDGNVDDTPTCDRDCTAAICGDRYINQVVGERCDNGNSGSDRNSDQPDAECRTNCFPQRCGDGIKDMGEQCDGGGPADDDDIAADTSTCDSDCSTAMCGDGYRNQARGEQCDDGSNGTPINTPTCDEDCSSPSCNDGIYNPAAEACDGTASGDTGCPSFVLCNSACTACQ